jgi:hypothetical protein
MNSLILEVAIGLVFVFAVFASLTSALTESIAKFLNLRADFLLRGLRALVDGKAAGTGVPAVEDLRRMYSPAPQLADVPAASASSTGDVEPPDNPPVPLTDTLLQNALIASQGQPDILPADTRRLSRKQKKNLPSYLPGRTFARALFAFLVPDTHGKTAFNELETAVNTLPSNSALKKSLQNLLANAEGDTEKFRLSIEHWYDDHMDRVSGWYKRRVRWISAGIGAVLILAFNVNAVPIVRTLYSDQALRASVVDQAVEAADCGDKDPAECLREVRQEIEGLRALGLPLGWVADPVCDQAGGAGDCTFFERFGLADRTANGLADLRFVLILLVGYAIMVAALIPGARFWFDLIGRFGSLRYTGPKPSRDEKPA